MITKFVEIRDEGTCIAALAIKMTAADAVEEKFLWRTGYKNSPQNVVLMQVCGLSAEYDPHEWCGGRTMRHAHEWIRNNFDAIIPGQVVDVQVILGERHVPAMPDIYTPNQEDAA